MSNVKSKLDQIDHFVVIMLENRSFDHMLGFLYTDQGNVSPLGHPFDGLTGSESNPDTKGNEVQVFKIPADENPYFWPGTDPGEGYYNTNSQLFGKHTTPPADTTPTNRGFIQDFAYTLDWQREANSKKANSWQIVENTSPDHIMGMYTPELLPVLSGLAKGYAVCDQWFCSVPTETLPNRAFVHMATCQGRLNDNDKTYTAKTIYNLFEEAGLSWGIYGCEGPPVLTRHSLQALPANPRHGSFGKFTDFQNAAKIGDLPNYTFLAPEWGANGNSQHPNYDVSKGEQYLLEIYQALRASPAWEKTCLVVTYDEHGGTYDHVAPQQNAKQPEDCPDNDGFDFKRFGVRVPAVLVSPLVEAGTVYRIPVSSSTTPLDHTSILSILEKRFGLPSLTARDSAAPDFSGVLTLDRARQDDLLENIKAPESATLPVLENNGSFGKPDHLQGAEASLAAQLPLSEKYHSQYLDQSDFRTEQEAKQYTLDRYTRYHNEIGSKS